MPNKLIVREQASPITRISDTEATIDMAKLRTYRLQRLRDQLKKRDLGGCVLFDPMNIRYATGSRNGTLLKLHNPTSYVFVPAEGPVVMFETQAYEYFAQALETVNEFRPGVPLSVFFIGTRVNEMRPRWAKEIADLMRQHSGANSRLAIDRCDPWAVHELAKLGIEVHDAKEPVMFARLIKSPEEIACMNVAITVAETGISRMRDALRPGMTENELWSILHQTNIAMGGEFIQERLLASGDRLNPWFQECSDRIIRAGELVGFDTDMMGPFGYFADVSRTIRCGPGKPTSTQKDLYKNAYEQICHNMALVKPGVTFAEFTAKSWKPPERYAANEYIVPLHGIGMCGEFPAVYSRLEWEKSGYDGVIEPGMTLCVESFIGAENGGEGVKLEDQVLVTENGCKLLSTFPFEDELLN